MYQNNYQTEKNSLYELRKLAERVNHKNIRQQGGKCFLSFFLGTAI